MNVAEVCEGVSAVSWKDQTSKKREIFVAWACVLGCGCEEQPSDRVLGCGCEEQPSDWLNLS